MPMGKYLLALLAATLITQCLLPATVYATQLGGSGDASIVHRYVFLVVVVNREPRVADIFVDGNITVSLNTSSGIIRVDACLNCKPFMVTARSSVQDLGLFYRAGVPRIEGRGKNVLLNITMVFPDPVRLYDKKFSVGGLRFRYSDGREINVSRSEYSESYMNGTVYSTVTIYAGAQFGFADTGGAVATAPGPLGPGSGFNESNVSETSVAQHLNATEPASSTDNRVTAESNSSSVTGETMSGNGTGADGGEHYIGDTPYIDISDVAFSALMVLVLLAASYVAARLIAGRVR